MSIPLLMCTLTGAENSTSLENVKRISAAYPFVEWGILFSAKQAGQGRYPSLAWITEFGVFAQQHGLNRSLHICGAAVYDLLSLAHIERQDIAGCWPYMKYFDRIQLNFNHKRQPVDIPALQSLIKTMPQTIITQVNSNNDEVTPELLGWRHAALQDSSGGRGLPASQWLTPPSICRSFGYAGGINAENLNDSFPQIIAASNGKPFWIDMEESLRTDDLFDLTKAEKILSLVAAYL